MNDNAISSPPTTSVTAGRMRLMVRASKGWFYLPELGRSVTVRGLAPQSVVLEVDPSDLEDVTSYRHPSMLALLEQGMVSPKLTASELGELSEESLKRLALAMIRLDRRTARAVAKVRGGGD